MAKPKKSVTGQSDGIPALEAGQKRKRTVEVFVCPTAFPDFSTVGGSTSRRTEQQRNNLAPNKNKYGSSDRDRREYNAINKDMPPVLDMQETIREVHKLGAEGFTGMQRKSHQNAELERLTGRTAKRQKIPTKILVGMRKKALKREEREKQELKESGVVTHHHHHHPSSQGKKKAKDKKQSKYEQGGGLHGVFGSNHARNTGDRRKMDPRSFGPAPDVGFMKKGMLKVRQP